MTRLSSLSLFTGAGGFDIGLEAAGFNVALCIEMDDDCKKTIHRNRPSWTLADPGDVHQLTPQEVMRQAGYRPRELTLLAGGPPCQPFSKSGYWANGDASRLQDPRAQTLNAYLTIIEESLPLMFVLENVKGLVFNQKDEGLRLLHRELHRINKTFNVDYQPRLVEFNCADYGVAQLRERVLVIAHREGKLFDMPTPTHAPLTHAVNGLARYTTAWDAIGDLHTCDHAADLDPSGKWADLLPTIPEGENYLWHTPRGGGKPLFGWRTRYWSFLLKLAKSKPSWTIQAEPGPATGPFHWANRRLSCRELCRLQTFPDTFNVVGSYRSVHRQIGNAVPPAMGELIGKELRRQFLGGRPHRQLKLIPTQNAICPRKERRGAVPKKYLDLAGAHRDHPGAGLGPGARKRAKQFELPGESK